MVNYFLYIIDTRRIHYSLLHVFYMTLVFSVINQFIIAYHDQQVLSWNICCQFLLFRCMFFWSTKIIPLLFARFHLCLNAIEWAGLQCVKVVICLSLVVTCDPHTVIIFAYCMCWQGQAVLELTMHENMTAGRESD